MTIAQEEFKRRMLALDDEEKRYALRLMPDYMLFDEVIRRYQIRKEKLENIGNELLLGGSNE